MQKRWVLKMMLSIVLCMSLLFSATPVSAVDVESEKIKSSPDSCVKCYTMFLPFLLIKIDVFS